METVKRENRTEWTSVMTRYCLFSWSALQKFCLLLYYLTLSFFLKFFPKQFFALRVDMETIQK